MKQLAGRDFEDLLQVCNMTLTMPGPLTWTISVRSPSSKDSFQRSTTKSSWIYYLNLVHGKCLQIYDCIQNQQFAHLRTPQPDWATGFVSFKPPCATHTTPMSYHLRKQLEDVEQQLQGQRSTTMVHLKMLRIRRRRQKSGSSKRGSTCQHTRYTHSATTLEQSNCLAPWTGSLHEW